MINMDTPQPQGDHWKVFALFFKNAMEAQGMTSYKLAKTIGASQSTITRFFNLDFCLRFDYVLKIAHALQLNLFFESREESAEMNKWFEDAMDQIGRRPDNLPKN